MQLLSISDVHVLNSDGSTVSFLHRITDLAQGPLIFGSQNTSQEARVDLERLIKIFLGEAPVLNVEQVFDTVLER